VASKQELKKRAKKAEKELRKMTGDNMQEHVVIDVHTRSTGACTVVMADSSGLVNEDTIRPDTIQRWTIFGKNLSIASIWPIEGDTVSDGMAPQEGHNGDAQVGGDDQGR
jgi:hypothetical protein